MHVNIQFKFVLRVNRFGSRLKIYIVVVLRGNSKVSLKMKPEDRLQPLDLEKVKIIQTQLGALLHAQKCILREVEHQNANCQTNHCKIMVETLLHLRDCKILVDCTVPHCSSSREILKHWTQCELSDCPVCSPLKAVQQPDAKNENGTNARTASTSGANSAATGKRD